MLPYFGGKGGKVGPWIFTQFDLKGIKNYVEPFSGMFGIYFHQKNDFSQVKNIIYNDIDLQNYNVIRCAQQPFDFQLEIYNAFKVKGGMFYHRGIEYEEIFQKYKELYYEYSKGKRELPQVNPERRNYKAAVIYSFLRLFAMHSMGYNKAGAKNKIVDSWYKRFKVMQPVWNKLRNPDFIREVSRIEVNSVDYKVMMDRYNNNESFIYLDPPYVKREKLYVNGKGVYDEDEHQVLSEHIAESKARIALSYYYFDGIYDLYPKDKYRYVSKTFRNNAGGKNDDEILIMNY